MVSLYLLRTRQTQSLLMLFAKFRPTCFHKAAEIPSGSNRSPEVPPMQSLLEVCAGFWRDAQTS